MALDGNFCRSLRDGLLTSFVDASVASEQNLRAQLLANDMSGSGTKVISVLEQELLRCQKFDFSVAFITMGGITPLLQTFKELEARGIKGRILTTNYLMFTDPRALEKLAGLSNIEIKLFRTEEAGQTGFHTKGYIFDRGRLRSIIVGSSNLTQTALTVNQEWNARLVSAAEGEFARQIQTEFDALWEHPASHALEDVLDDYRIEYEQTKTVRRAFFSQEPTLAGELGAFYKDRGAWRCNIRPASWDPKLSALLEHFARKTPRSRIERKQTALAWHYREADSWLGQLRAQQLVNALMPLCARLNLHILQGDKVVEIKSPRFTKGSETLLLLRQERYDFILALGDDTTDDDMFAALPPRALSIKIGNASEHARYNMPEQSEVVPLLELLARDRGSFDPAGVKHAIRTTWNNLKKLVAGRRTEEYGQ